MKTEEKGIRKLRLISISKFTNFNMHDIRHRTNLYEYLAEYNAHRIPRMSVDECD